MTLYSTYLLFLESPTLQRDYGQTSNSERERILWNSHLYRLISSAYPSSYSRRRFIDIDLELSVVEVEGIIHFFGTVGLKVY